MKLGFIGAGKMARALAQGLLTKYASEAGLFHFVASSRTGESGKLFAQTVLEGKGTIDLFVGNNAQVLAQCDVIILAIKPQQFAEVLPSLRGQSAGKLFISLAAGITLARIQEWIGPEARIIRAMPNTPMQIGAGASVYAGAENVTETDYAVAERILSAGGKAWRVPEAQIDAITALSGCGPAYLFHFIDALGQAGEALGLPAKLAQELALQTVVGSAKLAEQSSLAPLELAAQVKSPGGATLAGCAVLEKNHALENLLKETLLAAKNRAQELAGGLSR